MIKNLKFKIKNSRKGFTLIEMLVVIFVLGIGLVGALSFFNINFNNQFEAKNELIAAGLAQEGSDLVRSIVDNSYLNGLPWYGELTNKNFSTIYCNGVDRDTIFDDSYKCKNKPKNKTVCFDATSGAYNQQENPGQCTGDGVKTEFDRELSISGYNVDNMGTIDFDTGDCIQVKITVGWPNSDDACKADTGNCAKKTVSTGIICKPRQ
ncbi:MAG: prepilin-type N-terminal cleavage/methylation domain-containing protein [Candidatus Moraniibacteriota bacterium]